MYSQQELVNSLIDKGYLKTLRIISAFEKVDRADFVPRKYKHEAYADYPLPIGYGQTISQPLTVAYMLEILQPQAGDKILEIGAGSGFQTALLSKIVGRNGLVVALEIILELYRKAQKNLSCYSRPFKNIKLVLADGKKGYICEAPFDKIICGAEVRGSVPEAWRQQLKVGGKIVAPVKGQVLEIVKSGKNQYKEKKYGFVSFVSLK